MAFDLDSWKQKVGQSLTDWQPRMQRAGATSLYAFLSAASIWPVVEAVRAGEWAALAALGGTLAGVGTNLLANQIQGWKDESDGAGQLAAAAAKDAGLRAELDTVLEKLDTLTLAAQALPAAERPGYIEDLEAELTRLKNLPRFQATLRGIVVGGDAREAIMNSGDNNHITMIIHQYRQGVEGQLDEDRLRQQIAGYLKWVKERFGTIELRGIERQGQQVVQLKLETVYVPLAAVAEGVGRREFNMNEILMDSRESSEPGRNRGPGPAEAQAAADQGLRLAIIGGPGSGKTTVLQHIAWTLATAITTNNAALARTQLGLQLPPDKALPLPIFIPLSAYALHRRHLPPAGDPHEPTLGHFISRYLIEKQSELDLPRDFFARLLRDGQAVILLLDGLDEVPNDSERVAVREAIENLVSGKTMRVVVTCRTAAFIGRTALGKGFREVRVQPLAEDQVHDLVEQAYGSIYPNDPVMRRSKIDDLVQGIEVLEGERRRRMGEATEPLVTSPLLVRLLLVVHMRLRRLPDQRAELYMKATDAMLLPEYSQDQEVAESIGRLVGSLETHRELAQHLAFAMHQRGENQGREISEKDLRRVLGEVKAFAALADELIKITRLRGTLLEEREGNYRFIHLAFQEFLAARYLAEVMRGEKGVSGMVAFLLDGPVLDAWWREPALLLAGYLNLTSPQNAQLYLRQLAGVAPEVFQSVSPPPDAWLAAAALAASACLEWRTADQELRQELVERINQLFKDPSGMLRSRPIHRASAGNALAQLGDPRSEVMTLDGMEFCYVPGGPFIMGEGQEQHENHVLKDDYWLGRYPVTVAQFRAYLQGSGRQPEYPSSLWDPDNHPVRRVDWHEALAFCVWLGEKWRQEGILPRKWDLQLPSEAQWEKAARGALEIPAQPVARPAREKPWLAAAGTAPQKNPLPARIYPWGDAPDPNRANYDQTGIGDTSAMGCFPGGASPYGVAELSGNVWEWTRSLWGTDSQKPQYIYPYDPRDGRENLQAPDDVRRVLRGGAFSNGGGFVRCAFRGFSRPHDGRRGIGFRVVLSPLPLISGPSGL
ncbi:MAG: NACHT domain-containing protein [Chloroflexi bacterium]|nr:NACHT domain-containing protein [Chloroflexota bacterium]